MRLIYFPTLCYDVISVMSHGPRKIAVCNKPAINPPRFTNSGIINNHRKRVPLQRLLIITTHSSSFKFISHRGGLGHKSQLKGLNRDYRVYRGGGVVLRGSRGERQSRRYRRSAEIRRAMESAAVGLASRRSTGI